ncbi:MAG: hypothetical protein KY456_00220 [Chloroflexi bacterium]|nr:hypothetical protein [Chloroflexota bacterium]
MTDRDDDRRESFMTTRWDHHGIAVLEATGANARSALESGLRAVMTLAVGPVLSTGDATRSAPIHGEGEDLAELFVDMAEDLLAQIEHFGSSLDDVVVDGVLRTERGGYSGWGHASGTLEVASPSVAPRLLSVPKVIEEDTRVVIRARLHRTCT